MEKLAIISPGALPVPAVNGGAVETLITYLIELNEKEHKYDIDLYTIYDEKIKNKKYNYTNIICIKKSKFYIGLFLVLNKFYDFINANRMLDWYAFKVIKNLNKNKKIYEKMLVENRMAIFRRIIFKI